uniref:Uncharacterized protein n=1 Tax=Rousettus bat poxvirus TaxID=3141933 RepID=A0AAU7E1J6_9POXV
MDAGYKNSNKRRRRKPRTTVEEEEGMPCTTCSVCQSKLVMFSELDGGTRLGSLHPPAGTVTVQCCACNSALTPLSEFAK